MPTLGTFHESLRSEINRGSTVNDLIKSSLEETVQWLESTYTFEYMRKRAFIRMLDGTLQDSGTASGGTSNILSDTDKSWAGEYDGHYVILRPYRMTQESHLIDHVTLTLMSITDTWAVNPSSGDAYEIRQGIRSFDQPATKIREIKGWRILKDDGEYHYLTKIQDDRIEKFGRVGLPESYWHDVANSKLVIDSWPAETYDSEVSYVEKTDWPDDGTFGQSSYEHWLLSNAANVLRAATLLNMQPKVRGLVFKQNYGDLLPIWLNSLLREQDDAEFADSEEDNQMRFV